MSRQRKNKPAWMRTTHKKPMKHRQRVKRRMPMKGSVQLP